MKSTLSEYFKAKIQSVKAIAAQNTFYSCLQGSFEHSLNFQILREYLQSALFFLEGLDIWVQSTNFFFSDKYLVLIRTRLLLQRNLLRKKNHTHEIISCIHLLDSVFL